LLILSRNQQAFLGALQGKLIGISPEAYLDFINTVLSWAMYLSPLLGFVNVLLCAGIYHMVIVATVPKNRGFGATVRATAYGFIPLLLLAIPYIGQFLGGMWTLALQVIALSQIHRMSPWRAALVVLLPAAALLVLLAIPMLIKGPARPAA
jgi:Yip1 domain.